MRTKLFLAIVILAVGLLAGQQSPGRVFWRQAAPRGLAALQATAGWSTLQSYPVQINDGQGQLTILGCNEPLATVVERLRQAYGSQAPLEVAQQSATTFLAHGVENEKKMTLLALMPEGSEPSLLFVLSQSPQDAAKSASPPAAARLRDPPPYPGSLVQTHMGSQASRVQIEFYTAAASVAAVRQHYETVLAGGGWQRVDPAALTEGLAIYQRDRELCLYLVQAGQDGSSITVLHKSLNLE